jgi:hypothetical protein
MYEDRKDEMGKPRITYKNEKTDKLEGGENFGYLTVDRKTLLKYV